MDAVDRTFDTVYYYSQKASRLVSGAARAISDTTSNAINVISESIDLTKQKPVESPPISHNYGFSSGLGIQSFVGDHKLAFSAALGVSSLILTGYIASDKSKKKKKRRAVRLENGARKDVVLIVGSVTEPLTRYIANDLENRGFIVYITSTNSKADLRFFNNESIQDIKSLIISEDFQDSEFNSQQLHKFDFLLSSEHIPFQGAQPNKLNLIGIIFVPDLYFPSGKFHLIPGTTWTDNFNQKALLPLNLLNNGLIGLAEKYDSNVIFLTPTISSSLNLPFHSVENITSGLLQNLARNIAIDYESLNITNVKLGSVNINSNNNRKNFGIKGEPLKKLHYKLFDLLYNDHNNSVAYIGVGARFLDYCGWAVPRWIIRNYFNNYFGNE